MEAEYLLPLAPRRLGAKACGDVLCKGSHVDVAPEGGGLRSEPCARSLVLNLRLAEVPNQAALVVVAEAGNAEDLGVRAGTDFESVGRRPDDHSTAAVMRSTCSFQ
jgi:hypothetical protein